MSKQRVWIRVAAVGVVLALAGIACGIGIGGPEPDTTLTGLPVVPTNTAPPFPTETLLATSTSAPTVPPAPTQERVVFETGGISTTELGTVTPAAPKIYLVNVQAGQSMSLTLKPRGSSKMVLAVTAPSGTVLLDASAGQTMWTGVLPESGDYIISVTLLTSDWDRFLLDILIPPPNAQAPGECDVTSVNEADALYESSFTAEKFGTASAGETTHALARTGDGWIGFDPGVAQAGNEGRARLRWYKPGTQLTFSPQGCNNTLPLVLSLAVLENGTYQVGNQVIQFVNGGYADPAFVQGSADHGIAGADMGTARGFGDMNGDGTEDAAFSLLIKTGGTGTFVHIVVVLNVGGNPQPVPALYVGDRDIVNALRIDNGVLTADLTVHGPNDGGCCPSVPATWIIKLQGGALVKVG